MTDKNNNIDDKIVRGYGEQALRNEAQAILDVYKRQDLDNMVYAFDSSTISLCLKLCPWAKYRKNKGGIKMHIISVNGGNITSKFST